MATEAERLKAKMAAKAMERRMVILRAKARKQSWQTLPGGGKFASFA